MGLPSHHQEDLNLDKLGQKPANLKEPNSARGRAFVLVCLMNGRGQALGNLASEAGTGQVKTDTVRGVAGGSVESGLVYLSERSSIRPRIR